MSRGILVFARNNDQIDYIKQAYYLAISVKKMLNLPTTIVTDSSLFLKHTCPNYNEVFDNIIEVVWKTEDITDKKILSNSEDHSLKLYHDGTIAKKKLEFKNQIRTLAYDVTPYDETLLLDTDLLILDNNYKWCFEQPNDFLIYSEAYDLANFRDYSSTKFISDVGVTFYWATAVYFKKSQKNKIFFDLLKHVHENWHHYSTLYQINTSVYRNDHSFSIAIHMMNGYQRGEFAHSMPGKLFYTTDKDICWKIFDNKVIFLLEKQHYVGQYNLVKWSDYNIHVMNKFSLNRCIDEILNNE